MRYVSEAFKKLQSELVRLALRMYFEIDTRVTESLGSASDTDERLNLDYDYTPVIRPNSCTNEHFYAVLGDTIGVDDPNRICAPAIPNGVQSYDIPNGSVPFGVTIYRNRNYEAQIGTTSPYYENVIYGAPMTLSFKGGLIPEQVRVLKYDRELDDWVEETIIYNPDMKEEITFTPNSGNAFMFLPRNSQKAGRYQLNWIKGANDEYGLNPVIFEDNLISNISISEETDLTSQALPSYEMTVECLDIEEQYTPDTEYWENQFKDGVPCYLKVGYEINGKVEGIPFFYGILNKAPTYSAGKLTFTVSVDWKRGRYGHLNTEIKSNVSRDLNPGDLVLDNKFSEIMDVNSLFDTIDIFSNLLDDDNSVCNHFAELERDISIQMIANALGGYVTANVNAISLYNTNKLQYKEPVDNVTRFEQIQNTLESQPKVGKIVVTRNENRLSGTNTAQVTLANRVYIHAGDTEYVDFPVPFYAIGKFVVNDYQKSVPSAVVGTDYSDIDAYIGEDGNTYATLGFYSDVNTYIQPIVTFYGVDNKQFPETSYPNDGEGEIYENDNDLVTNSYISGKVKRVAQMVNDVSNQYEVDMMQDLRYELGDVVRLETQPDIFKTCVITGLNFNFPGSVGHMTCRKIFNIADVSIAKTDVVGATITFPELNTVLTILETNGKPVVIGKCINTVNNSVACVMLNVRRFEIAPEGVTPYENNTYLLAIDNNDEGWEMCFYDGLEAEEIETPLEYLTLPDYAGGEGVPAIRGYSAIEMVTKIYEAQGMTAPIDYASEVRVMPLE